MTDRTVFSRLASSTMLRRAACLLLTGIGTGSVHAADNVPVWPEDHFHIGVGYGGDSNPYIGGAAREYPVPMVSARWGGLFVEGWRAGMEFFRFQKVSLALAGMWDVNELDLTKINSANQIRYQGIEERKPTAQVGVIGIYHSPVGIVEASYFHDVTATHDSSWTNLKISNPIPETGNWYVNPGFFVKTYAEKYNRYYYGVSREDNIRGAQLYYNADFEVQPEVLANYERDFRPRYKPGNSGHIGFDLELDYQLTSFLKIESYWGFEILTGEVETSPLVEDKEIYWGQVGLTLTF